MYCSILEYIVSREFTYTHVVSPYILHSWWSMLSVTIERVETLEFPLTEASNYYLVRTGDLEIAVDAGAKSEFARPPSSGWVLVTHWHWDHVMGLAGSRGLNVCMSKKTYNIIIKYYKSF